VDWKFLIDMPVNGKPQKALVVARDEDTGDVLAKDQGDPFSVPGRKKLLDGLYGQKKLRARASLEQVQKKLEAASDLAAAKYLDRQHTQEAEAAQEEAGPPRLSQADRLVLLTQGIELFHTPGGCDSEGYATLHLDGHRETWPINSSGFRRWLSKRLHDEHGKVPGSQPLQDALNVIAGKAIHEGAEYPVAVRLAEQGGAIYLDLADAAWRAVRITPSGWEVVHDCPVKFVRRRGMLALPEPTRGGGIDDLRGLVNVPDADSWALIVACLLAALRPGRPFPVLAVNGEQGSAKSTLCRMLRALIDPNQAPLRRPPREDRDLMIAATNSWVIAFDNLSGIRPELSDALCCLATGGGFGTRELYTDDGEKLFSAMRPVVVNGIEEVVARPDLLDRAVVVTLPPLDETQRRDEEQLWRDFEAVRPRVLGALLDAVSAALKNRAAVRLTRLPRMADFAAWVVAAEPALGWQPGTFLAAYEGNRSAGATAALENSLLAPVLFVLLPAGASWRGTARELLGELERRADEKTRKHRDWPASPRRLAGEVRRLAPSLRAVGLAVTFERENGGRRRRLITLERPCATPSLPSLWSQTGENTPPDVGRSRDGRDDARAPDRPAASPENPAVWDHRDGRDGVAQQGSNPAEDSEVL
jgi:hypothetical protein